MCVVTCVAGDILNIFPFRVEVHSSAGLTFGYLAKRTAQRLFAGSISSSWERNDMECRLIKASLNHKAGGRNAATV